MKLRAAFILICLFAFNLHAALPPEYGQLKADAEKLYADGSFAKAAALYGSASPTNLPAAEQRWVEFRRADTQWRSQAATQTADTTKLDAARDQLEKLVRDVTREEDRDRVWVEVQESLGDFHWTRRNQQNWGAAWPHYQPALDWWAGAPDIELARQRYLSMIWRIVRPPGLDRGYAYGYWGNYVPLEVLDNVLKIAQTANDQARAHFLVAMTIRNQGGQWEQRARVPEEFEGALKIGKSTDWYDDALYLYAEWMLGQGRAIPLENGGWRQEPDFVKALELFRRLVSEFNQGETRYWEQAQQQIKAITDPQLGVSVPNIFLPDSEIQYALNWRNVKQIELALYPVDLNRDVNLGRIDEHRRNDWLQTIDLAGREKAKSWTHTPKGRAELPLSQDAQQRIPTEDYRPGNETLRLDGKLKPGAYVLEARGGGKEARELVLVTDATLVLKTSGKQALVYFCNALDGSPLANSKVRLWERWHEGQGWQPRDQSKQTGADGLAVFELASHSNNNVELFASAALDDRQAFSAGNSYWAGRLPVPVRLTPAGPAGVDPTTGLPLPAEHKDGTPLLDWRIYAFTDRPAYRPRETVNWKFIARWYDGSVYSTPAGQTLKFTIIAPNGSLVKEGEVKLNAFGSAWDSLELTEQMPLGEYLVVFRDARILPEIGSAKLFRLEEYKLPEFKVTVATPEDDGRKKAFRLGEKVEVAIQADYYFGGPVANASVEVLVYQNPYWHWWHEPRPFPWFYEDMDGNQSRWGRNYGGGQIVKRETIKTDATGRATLMFETPANSGQDFEYRIEARVTDSSRREITGSGSVRVTRQRYYVSAQPEHNLYRPQDKVAVNFKALDANEQPVQAEGTVKVTRDYWFEIWLAPDGREVKGDELKRQQAESKIWPPPPARPDQKNWRLKFRGYEHDDILTRTLKTDTNGEAQLTFTPERDGYYRVAWTSADAISNLKSQISNPVSAETTVWVCSSRTTDLGYRHDGVEIIADKDTFRVGQKAPVMLVANSPGRYVLFSVEGEDLDSYQLVHLDGTVKLVELSVEEKHVPNMFLNAALVSDREVFTDVKQIVVPPTKNFLTVDVQPDRAQYQPRDEGTLTVTTKNDEGKPVSAEVALGLVDESVFYIQGDYAGDPRQFYFGTKREHRVQTQSTRSQKSYAKLVVGDDEQLLDERDKERRRSQARNDEAGYMDAKGEMDSDARYVGGGMGGGGGGGARQILSRDELPKYRGVMPSPAARAKAVLATDALDMPAPAMEMAAAPPGSAPRQEPAVVVRSDFRSTVFWQPDVITGQDGKATVKVKYPDSTTSWKATARAATAGNQFGIADATTRTKQPLIVRLQAPRFFVVGDTVTISAVVNNNTEHDMVVYPRLELEGVVMITDAGGRNPNAQYRAAYSTNVLANSEVRVDWLIEAKQSGTAKLKVTIRNDKFALGDAMEKSFPVYEHGIEKFITKSGKARGNDITVKLDLPKERKAGSTALTVQVTPSMAVTMLDALPYLIDYPYGCTEQTMSRFLPVVITAKTLRDLGLEPADVMGRAFGGIETNSAAATHPKGKRDLAELDQMTKAGLERLYDFQHADGGWGWWKAGESDHWMTAYVVWGLALAKEADVKVKQDVLDRGLSFLDKTLVEEEENLDMQAFMLHALAASHSKAVKGVGLAPSKFQAKAFDNLWANREKLNAYTRALLAMSAHRFGYADKAKTLIANLENGVKRDERPDASVLIKPDTSHLTPDTAVQGTAHWGEDGVYWRWSEGGVEATAFALRALLAIDPTNQLVEPVANWLIKNRRGAQWSNTRDTAIVVLAMNDYLRVSGELKGEVEYDLYVNGTAVAHKKISGADVFAAPSRFTVDPKLIKENNEIRITTKPVGRASSRAEAGKARQEPRPTGEPPLYFAAEAKFFSLEEPIAPAGSEIFVKREYFKLVGRPTLLKGYVYDKQPLGDGESVKSGERVETVLTIEGKNHYEYLMFEDLKPAGFEAVEIRSGESLYTRELKSGAVERKFAGSSSQSSVISHQSSPAKSAIGNRQSAIDYTGRQRWVYQELRDRKVALFIDQLPEGVWEIRYDLRAEAPGRFHALPVLGQAMYVPEIRCNGAEIRVQVEEAR